MAQIFHHSTNTIARVSDLWRRTVLIALLGYAVDVINNTSYVLKCTTRGLSPFPSATNIMWVNSDSIAPLLPLFHVEVSSSAGMPQGQTCMANHSRVLDGRRHAQSQCAPAATACFRLRSPEDAGKRPAGLRVDFNHGVHVAKGVELHHVPSAYIAEIELYHHWRAQSLYGRMVHGVPPTRGEENITRPRSGSFQRVLRASKRPGGAWRAFDEGI